MRKILGSPDSDPIKVFVMSDSSLLLNSLLRTPNDLKTEPSENASSDDFERLCSIGEVILNSLIIILIAHQEQQLGGLLDMKQIPLAERDGLINGSEVHCKGEHQFDEGEYYRSTTRRSEDMENE